jgi:quercetin dioxygenase-like cupin family protein
MLGRETQREIMELRTVWALLVLGAISAPAPAVAQGQLVIQSVAEQKIDLLPAGALYWRVETFPTLALAQGAAGATSLTAEVAGKAWLFTLGAKGGATPGGKRVAELGPVPAFSAPAYLLRINHASGPPGSETAVHTHPGSESFYVLAGQVTQRTPDRIMHADAGEVMTGHAPGTVMQASSRGNVDLDERAMLVVDATKPFSAPAKFE